MVIDEEYDFDTEKPPVRDQDRDYQIECIEAVERAWEECARALIVMATGGGKTRIFSRIAQKEIARGGRVLILAHTEELIEQAQDKLFKATGLASDKEKADLHASPLSQVVVGSIQTFCRLSRLQAYPDNHFTLVIADEAHRSLSPSWQRVLRYFHFGAPSLDENWLMPEPGVPYEPKARILGVTATADRGDKRTLGEFFQKVAYEWGLLEACRDGYLVRPIVRNIPPEKGTELDLRGIKLSRISGQADFDVAEVSNRITPYLAGMAKSIALHAKDRKTVCFLPSIETARIMSLMLSHHGLNASFVSGACPDRTEKIAAFHEAGNGSAIANAMLLTEGWDSPEVSCICVLRPTKIRALLSQCIGRGTRTWPGAIDGLTTPQKRLAAIDASPKRDLLILDFLWLTDRLDLVKPIDLIASKPEIRKLMEESGESDLLVAEASAQRDLLKALEKAAKKNSKKKERVIDPLAWAVSLGDTALAGWEPESKWDELPPTSGQIELLAKQGIDTKNISARGLASKIIDRLLSRMKLKLCTPKQLTLLLQFGYDEHKVALMTIDQASGVIGRAIASRR